MPPKLYLTLQVSGHCAWEMLKLAYYSVDHVLDVRASCHQGELGHGHTWAADVIPQCE